jgi:hypothetical protein
MIGIRNLSSSWRSGCGQIASESARGAAAVLGAFLAVVAVGAVGRAALETSSEVPPAIVATTVGAQIPTSDSWTERLTDSSAWRGGKFRGRQRAMSRDEERRERDAERREREDEARRAREERLQEEREAREERLREEREAREEALASARELGRQRGTYRTVCVRTCDGYFFPISFATTPDRFGADEAACRSRCSSSARLYVYPNPGAEPEQMVNLAGQPYSALKSAFLFRTSYDAGCTCKPHPWDKEALDRHRAFAEAQKGVRSGRSRTVARTVRTEPAPAVPTTAPATPATAVAPAENGAARPQRPDGAMLLGADETQPKPAKKKSSATRNKSASSSGRSSGSSGSDWSRRAFRGD